MTQNDILLYMQAATALTTLILLLVALFLMIRSDISEFLERRSDSRYTVPVHVSLRRAAKQERRAYGPEWIACDSVKQAVAKLLSPSDTSFDVFRIASDGSYTRLFFPYKAKYLYKYLEQSVDGICRANMHEPYDGKITVDIHVRDLSFYLYKDDGGHYAEKPSSQPGMQIQIDCWKEGIFIMTQHYVLQKK